MLRCKICFKHRSSISEEGICDGCVLALRKDSKNLYIEFMSAFKAVPKLQNGSVLSKTQWFKMKRAIDTFYNSISIEEIDAYNAALKKTRVEKVERVPIDGYVYLLSSSTSYYKLGRAKNVDARIRSHLRDYPIDIDLIHTVACANVVAAEQYLLSRFSEKRVQGEWFRLSSDDVNWIMSLDESKLAELVRFWVEKRKDSL